MNISNSTAIPTQFTNSVSGINNQPPVKRIELEREKNSEQESSNAKRTERFDVNEESLALVEQEYQANQSNQANQNNSQNGFQQSTDYDTPSEQNLTAVSAYESVDNLAKKESVQQLFGVDLYA